MLDYAWPIALVVFSNVIYQICAKAVPDAMDPFASLTITYLAAALASAVLFFLLGDHASLARDMLLPKNAQGLRELSLAVAN